MNNFLLLCATDIGAVRNMIPLIDLIKSKGLEYVLITSEETLTNFNRQDIQIEQPKISSLEDAVKYLNLKMPAAVICGTSRHLRADRFLVAAAGQLKIKSIAILDEWFYYRKRFENENGQLIYLPDIICCQDQRALKEAIAEGIPNEYLVITGSSYLSALTDLAENSSANPPPIPDFITHKVRPIITFLSEPFSLSYGEQAGQKGLFGDFVGFTEYIVREHIFNSLKSINLPCTVVEKLHPTTNNKLIPLGDGLINWFSIKEAEILSLLWHSDLVIGMRSMALLEAAVLGSKAVSYQPNLSKEQMCTAVRLKLVKDIYKKEELQAWIKERLSSESRCSPRQIRRFPFAREDASEKILGLALSNESRKNENCCCC